METRFQSLFAGSWDALTMHPYGLHLKALEILG